jgi:hypothetical protein
MKKFVLVLIMSLCFFGSASAAPAYTLSGGQAAVFNSANTNGYLEDGVVVGGINVSFGYFGQILFNEPSQVIFNTLFNSISPTEGVLSVTDNYPFTMFSNQGTSLTVSPVSHISMIHRDDNLVGEPGFSEVHHLGMSSSPVVGNPVWSIIPTGDHTLLGIAQFDQSNPDLGYWAFEISTPVPEPETYAMLLVGLAMIGFTMRKVITDPGGMVSV